MGQAQPSRTSLIGLDWLNFFIAAAASRAPGPSALRTAVAGLVGRFRLTSRSS